MDVKIFAIVLLSGIVVGLLAQPAYTPPPPPLSTPSVKVLIFLSLIALGFYVLYVSK
jgi:hypothetical protein